MATTGAKKLGTSLCREGPSVGTLGGNQPQPGIAESQVHKRLRGHRGYRAVQALHGVGRVSAAIFVAEIGDITRFADARQLCSWAGLTPSHRQSDDIAHRGHITKQGSTLVRWAAVEASCATTAAPPSPRRSCASRSGGARRSLVWRRQGNCSPWSSTGCATAKSAASRRRPLDQGLGTAKARARRSTWPPKGEADELNAPAWLWPELTMHLPTGRRNVRQPGPGLPAQFLSKVTSLLCPPTP